MPKAAVFGLKLSVSQNAPSTSKIPVKLAVLFSFILVVSASVLAAQTQPYAPHVDPLLDLGYRQMYNLQFDEAHRTFGQYERQHPGDPLGPVSDSAAYLFAEFERLDILRSDFALNDENFFSSHRALTPDPGARKSFEADIQKTQQLAEPGLHRNPPDLDSMFASTLRLGLHADYEALIEKRSLAALTEVKQARMEADKLLMIQPTYFDGYIAIALENYLLSLKPAPVRWFLHATGAQTDRQTGIEKLRLTAEHGHYLLPYARLLLAVAALRDHDRKQARQGLEWLATQFPGNKLYREELDKLN
jgi:hypothetical protein